MPGPYDFYVVHHANDYKIGKYICGKLEDRKLIGYLDDRDGEMGRTHFHNLENALESCHKIILVVTGHCVDDAWFQFKSQTSILKGLESPAKQYNVIPVYHNITQEQVPHVLSTIHGVPYTPDDSKFWDRLYKSVCRPGRST